jgi:hypothetical protein
MFSALLSAFTCRHSQITWPITPLQGPRKKQTYVACCTCGREFEYNWSTMQTGEEIRREAPGGTVIALRARSAWIET